MPVQGTYKTYARLMMKGERRVLGFGFWVWVYENRGHPHIYYIDSHRRTPRKSGYPSCRKPHIVTLYPFLFCNLRQNPRSPGLKQPGLGIRAAPRLGPARSSESLREPLPSLSRQARSPHAWVFVWAPISRIIIGVLLFAGFLELDSLLWEV